jgi:hypothetical protein
VKPPGFEEQMADQEAVSILLLRVALRLLGEARLRGEFGDEEMLGDRAVALADELTGGAPSPDPRRATVEVGLLRPDRISLSAPFKAGSATSWSLMLDGTLYDGGTTGSVRAVRIDPKTLSAEERADLERRQAEWQARIERLRQFTATRYVRTIAAPPQAGAAVRVLAVLLYEDGFWVDSTYDKEEPPRFDPSMDAETFLALDRDEKPELTIADDLGTEYFESGGGGRGGGVRVSHATYGFAPAPPSEARVLRVTTEAETVEFYLRN